MALAAALHHSAGPKETMVDLRGQNTGAHTHHTHRATEPMEEVVQDAHVALRGQKTPPPGARPGRLVDPGPQRSDRTVRRSSGKDPLLVVASLADASPDGVDTLLPHGFCVGGQNEGGGGRGEEGCGDCEESGPQCVAAAPHKTKVELSTLVNLSIHRTPAQLRRMVELAEEHDVINASIPGPSSASSSSRRKKKEEGKR